MPKTKEQFNKIKQTRKMQIAISGLKVFCEKGYDGTTVDDIVKKAKCSHGLFYHYYKSKKEIFDEVIRLNHEEKQLKLSEAINNASSFSQKLRIITNTMFDELKNDENFAYYYYFFVSQCFSLKEKGVFPPKRKNNKKTPFEFLQELFSQGQASGEFSNKYTSKECAEMFLSIIQGAALGYVISPKEIQQKIKLPNVDFIIDTFLKGDK